MTDGVFRETRGLSGVHRTPWSSTVPLGRRSQIPRGLVRVPVAPGASCDGQEASPLQDSYVLTVTQEEEGRHFHTKHS